MKTEINGAQIAKLTEKEQRALKLPTYEKLRIPQTRGPTIKAEAARLLARQEFETKGRTPCAMVFEIYETQGGALIAVSRSTPIEFDGFEDVRAVVVDAIPMAQSLTVDALKREQKAMHLAVLDFYDWEDRARTMARKLKWDLNKVVL